MSQPSLAFRASLMKAAYSAPIPQPLEKGPAALRSHTPCLGLSWTESQSSGAELPGWEMVKTWSPVALARKDTEVPRCSGAKAAYWLLGWVLTVPQFISRQVLISKKPEPAATLHLASQRSPYF